MGRINRQHKTQIGLVPPFRKYGEKEGAAKFFLTHAELQTFKRFQDKLMMASHNTLQKNSSKQYQILCQHKTEMHYECLFLFQKVYQYAMCTLKQDFCLRGMPLSCQFFLLFRDCKSKCQQHLNAVTHSSLQPVWYWLFLTFALTCHQKLGRNSFPITITKGLSPKFSWGWGRKNMKEGQVWIYQLAFWNNPGTFFLN